VFNTVVGNADGHAKNLSLLRGRDGRIRLAPFYDLLSTAVYPGIATRLAMTIGENDDPGHICGRDWRQLAGSVGIGPAFLLDIVRTLAEAIPERARTIAAEFRTGRRDSPAAELILPVLRKRSRRLLQLLSQ
jgi:serine/threonine-protein kinase HipA